MRVQQIGTDSTSQLPDSTSLTPQAQQLLDLVREAQGWVNRTTLARRTGKSSLNKWDLVLLDRLVESGLIEARQIPRHGPIGYEWQYCAVQIAGDAEQDG
jgi:hypothetical protein